MTTDSLQPGIRAASAFPCAALRGRMRDALVTAAVTALMGLPLIGVEIMATPSGTTLRARFDLLALAVAVVAIGRLATGLAIDLVGRGQVSARLDGLSPVKAHAAAVAPIAGVAGLVLAAVLPLLPFSDRYVLDLATTVLIYVMLGWGLNIVVGLAGLLDLGYVAFYAAGAYSFALLATHYGLGFWICLPISGLVAAVLGVALGFPVLRLRGDYLAIVTLGFGEIIRLVLLNWQSVTGGPNGIGDLPRPTFLGLTFARTAPSGEETFAQFFGLAYAPEQRAIFLYFVILALALALCAFTQRVRRLPLGQAWEALREDEIACAALGINPTRVKLTAFATGALFGGLAGCFFAAKQGFISPESFTFQESATVLAIVVLGGMGSHLGVALAALVLVALPEIGREFADYRMVLFGAAMVAIMLWRPRGLVAARAPSIRLDERVAGTQQARR